MNDSSIESRVRVAVSAALDKKAIDLDVLAVAEVTSIADYFILSSATSERQAQAIADNVVDKLREELNVKPLLVEGTTPGPLDPHRFRRPHLPRLHRGVPALLWAGAALG